MKIKDQIADESSESDEEDRKVGLTHPAGRNRHDIVSVLMTKILLFKIFSKVPKKIPPCFPILKTKSNLMNMGKLFAQKIMLLPTVKIKK